jgi:signal transduction histidine kinase
LSNAIRYSDPAKKQSITGIEVNVSQQEAELTITDNGIGIGEQHLEKIFDMFHRATECKSGSGLGLYIV